MADGWGRIPLLKLEDLVPGNNESVIVAIYIDTETDEFVIEYYIPE